MKVQLLIIALLGCLLVGCSGGVGEGSSQSDAEQINNRIKEAGGEVPAGGTQDGS